MDFNNTLPEWQNTGTEPSDTLKNNGFAAGYKPPANVFNWFWHKVSAAITELQTKLTGIDNAIDVDEKIIELHKSDKSNPHSVNKAQVGLGNVDNTSDADKPISTKTQTALDLKANNTDIIPNDSSASTGIINTAGWYRLASFKGSSNNSTRGSSCNSCEIVIQRAFSNTDNEYHHLYFISTFLSHKFCSIVNQSNYHLFDKIRYVEETDDNGIFTAYIDIHQSITNNNEFSYKILNSKTRNASWKCSFKYLGNNDDIDGQVVYTIPANSELAQKADIINVQTALNTKQTVEIITDIDSFFINDISGGYAIGTYNDSIGIHYVFSMSFDNNHKQVAISQQGIRERYGHTDIDGVMTWGTWTNTSGKISTTKAFTLTSYRDCFEYDFAPTTKYAIVNVLTCKNGDAYECVNTMVDIGYGVIWFMKPQGITSTVSLDITFEVIEF